MKRFFALLIFSAFLSSGAFAQRSYSDAEKQREDFYKEEIPSIVDGPEASAPGVENEVLELPVFREDLLGFGLSIMGPEISYSHRRDNLQLDLSLAVSYYPSFSFYELDYLALWPKFDIGCNFYPQATPSVFVGGFITCPFFLKFGEPIFFAPELLIGLDASIMLRLTKNVELSFTSYLPVPVLELFGYDNLQMLASFFVMLVAPLVDLTVDLRFRL